RPPARDGPSSRPSPGESGPGLLTPPPGVKLRRKVSLLARRPADSPYLADPLYTADPSRAVGPSIAECDRLDEVAGRIDDLDGAAVEHAGDDDLLAAAQLRAGRTGLDLHRAALQDDRHLAHPGAIAGDGQVDPTRHAGGPGQPDRP